MEGKHSIILIIVDGLSDVAVAKFQQETPMQRARMPNMDALTRGAVCGLHDPVRPGLACGSDTAHLNMFGYDAERVYRGRGAFEAEGAGLELRPGDVAFKCNLATLGGVGSGVVARRCAGASFGEPAARLCVALDGAHLPSHPEVRVRVLHAGGHRAVVSLCGPGLSDAISNTDPLSDGLPLLAAAPTRDSPAARYTAAAANAACQEFRRILANDPAMRRCRADGRPYADVLLLRGAAEQIALPAFEKRTGLHTFLVAPTKIIKGIGRTAQMDIVDAPGATGGYSTDLESKAVTCLERMGLKKEGRRGEYVYDMGIIHIKAVDEAGHDRDVDKKVEWLEKFDEMMGSFLEMIAECERENLVLVVTGDHSTAADYGDHTCEPVPIIFADLSHYKGDSFMSTGDSASTFDEINIGRKGSLGRFPGSDIMPMIQHLAKGQVVKGEE